MFTIVIALELAVVVVSEAGFTPLIRQRLPFEPTVGTWVATSLSRYRPFPYSTVRECPAILDPAAQRVDHRVATLPPPPSPPTLVGLHNSLGSLWEVCRSQKDSDSGRSPAPSVRRRPRQPLCVLVHFLLPLSSRAKSPVSDPPTNEASRTPNAPKD